MCLPDHGRPSFQLPGQCALRLLLQTHSCFAVLQAAGMGMGMGMMPPGQVNPQLHRGMILTGSAQQNLDTGLADGPT